MGGVDTVDDAESVEVADSDDVLVRRAVRGDAYAFEQLVRRHQQRAYAVALRITGRPSDAEDAAQTAFVTAWRKLDTFRHDAQFGTWLYRIVTTRALNVLRARRDELTLDDGLDDPHLSGAMVPQQQVVSRAPGPADTSQAEAMLTDLRAAVAALPEPLRVCWWAHEVDGYTYREVAEMTGAGADAVRGRIFRARQRIASAMEGWR